MLLAGTALGCQAAPTARPHGEGQPSAAPSVTVPRGALLYEAKLAGTGEDLRAAHWPGGDPSAAAIRFPRGAIELAVLKPGGEAAAAFNMAPRETYVGELELSVTPGSLLALYWSLRSLRGGEQQYVLVVYTRRQAFELSYWDGVAGTQESLTPLYPIWDLQTGRVFTLTVAVERERYTLFVDGEPIGRVDGARTGGPTVPSIGFTGNEGSVRIVGARFFEVAAAGQGR